MARSVNGKEERARPVRGGGTRGGLTGFLLIVLLLGGLSCSTRKDPGSGSGLIILCAGDSLTAVGYPAPLEERLAREGLPARVINQGVKGHTSGEYLRFLEKKQILPRSDPDIVLLQLGTNDVRIDGDHTPTPQFMENMNEIIRRISAYRNTRGRTPRLLIALIPPVKVVLPFYFDARSEERVEQEINPAIVALARTWNLILVDNHRLFLEHPEWLPEIHPTAVGYQGMADNWFQALLPVVRNSR